MDNSTVRGVGLETRSANASSTPNPSNVLDSDHRDFSGITDGLQMTVSSRFNSNTNLDRIDGTRGSFTVEAGSFSVSGGNFDRRRNTHIIRMGQIFAATVSSKNWTAVACSLRCYSKVH